MKTLQTKPSITRGRRLSLLASLLLLFAQLVAQAQDATPTPGGVSASRQASNIAVITIHGPIDEVTTRSIKRRIEIAQKMNADAIVFDIDTWGGLATAAIDINLIIKDCPITNTIGWVHPKAISAGTFIALACKEIVISPGGYMGDCAPILPGLIPMPAAERAKAESPLLAIVVDSARRRGYDERLLMSFVAVDIELWLVENKETGDRLFVDRTEYQLLFGSDPPPTVRSSASGGVPSGDMSSIKAPVPFLQEIYQQQSDTLTPEQIADQVEKNQEFLSKRPQLSLEDRGKYELVAPVIDDKTLLVANAHEARQWGLSQATVANEAELKSFVGATSVTWLEPTWSENLVQVLTSMPVRALLLVVFLVGLIWEMATPGIGVPMTIALAAALLLFGAPALTGLAQWWDIVLVLVGFCLLAAELFLIPGFGVAGIAGIICIGLGFIGTFIAPDPSGSILPTSELARQAMVRGASTLLLGFFAGGVAMWMGVKHFTRIPGLSRLVLSEQLPRSDDADSLLGAMAMPVAGPGVGSVGMVVSTLRPIGRARFGATIYDVVAERGIIEEGRRVRVVFASAFKILVEDADEPA
ncbi:MAG: hypothetical protein IT430_15135 [Phycisphaerales bacterium]|nr:hypothetical protein [Phycisphaerales bacterium]